MPKKSITKKNRKGLKIKNKTKSRSRKIQKRLKRKKMRKSRKKQLGGANLQNELKTVENRRIVSIVGTNGNPRKQRPLKSSFSLDENQKNKN